MWNQKPYPASFVVQSLRIHLAVQGTLMPSLVQEGPHAMEQLSPCAATTEAFVARAHDLQ